MTIKRAYETNTSWTEEHLNINQACVTYSMNRRHIFVTKTCLCDLQHGHNMRLAMWLWNHIYVTNTYMVRRNKCDYETKPVWLVAWTENTFMRLWNKVCVTCSMDRKPNYVTSIQSLCDLRHEQKMHLCDYETKPVWLVARTKKKPFMWLWNQAWVTYSIRHIFTTHKRLTAWSCMWDYCMGKIVIYMTDNPAIYA